MLYLQGVRRMAKGILLAVLMQSISAAGYLVIVSKPQQQWVDGAAPHFAFADRVYQAHRLRA